MRHLLLLFCVVMFAACATAPNIVEPDPIPSPTVMPTAAPVEPVVETIQDVLYAKAIDSDAVDQKLDITYLTGTSAPKPVVIWAHGALQGTDKSAKDRARFAARALAENGFVVLAIDYNPEVMGWNSAVAKAYKNDGEIEAPQTMFREVIENGACALKFAAETAEQYGGDPQRVIWAGVFNGSWLGTMVSLGEGDIQSDLNAYATANGGPDQRVECVAGTEQASVIGLVASSAMYLGDFWLNNDVFPWWTPVYAPMQKYAAVGHNPDLKVRYIHGERDTEPVTAFANTEALVSALTAAGYDAAVLPQSDVGGVYEEQMIEQILAFAGD